MRLLELTIERLKIEELLGIEAKAYGLYSVDEGCYFSFLNQKNYYQQELMEKGYLFEFKRVEAADSLIELIQYLLSHHCQLYYPAYQKGIRNGYKITFPQEEIVYQAKELGIIQDEVREELSGQLCFCI